MESCLSPCMWPLAQRWITELENTRRYYTVNCFILYKVHHKTPSPKDYFDTDCILQKAHVCTLLVFCGALHKFIYKKKKEKKKRTEKEVYPDKCKSRLCESKWIMSNAVFWIKAMCHRGCISSACLNAREHMQKTILCSALCWGWECCCLGVLYTEFIIHGRRL